MSFARVRRLDMVLGNEGNVRYRSQVEVAFQVDHTRRSSAGSLLPLRRYLVVGNETLTSPGLAQLLGERLAEGPSEFHVVVPCTPLRSPAGASVAAGDPMLGAIDPDAVSVADLDSEAHERARVRLEQFIADLRELGAGVTGEVGPANPLAAVQHALRRGSFDEIVLSTLPASRSRWLRMDLPSRLRRTTSIPVTHIESTADST